MASFIVNGQEVSPSKNQKLLRFLRDELHITSAKDGCSEGACGACTVIIDGQTCKSCVPDTDSLAGKNVITVEGLSDWEQKVYTYAYGKAGAVQCGFCIPGMVMCTKALLDVNPEPTDDEIRYALRNNYCRCTGYVKIIAAVRLAAKALPAAQYAVASSFSQPVRTGWADLLLNCFSPFAQEEFLRVLRPGGRMIYVVPGAEHLYQMKAVLYEKPYKNPVQQVEYPGFRAIDEREVQGTITVPAAQLEALFAMTPYYWKTPRDGAARLAALPQLTTTIAFRFLVFEKL